MPEHPLPSQSRLNTLALLSLLLLIALCVVWEALYTPLGEARGWVGRPAGVMVLKAFPLLFFIRPLLQGRRRAYQGMTLLVWPYFMEGVVRGWGDRGASQMAAWLETGLTLVLFGLCVARARELTARG